VHQKHCHDEGDGSKSMWIKVGAGLSAVIVVLFFSACTYTMRRRTNLRTGITKRWLVPVSMFMFLVFLFLE